MKTLVIMLLALAMFIASTCSKAPTDVAGGISDAGNALTISGKAVDTNGHPVAKAMVRVCSADFVLRDTSEAVHTVLTDNDGSFEITHQPIDHFVLEINNGEKASLHEFSIGTATGSIIVNDTLKPIGKLQGNISNYGLIDSTVGAFATLVGTANWAVPDSSGNFTFPALPPGDYTIRVVYQKPDITFADTVQAAVKSGETKDIDTLFSLTLLNCDSIQLRTIIADTSFDTIAIQSYLRLAFRLKPASFVWNSFTTPATLDPAVLLSLQFNLNAYLRIKIFDNRTTLRRIDSGHYEVTWSPFNIQTWQEGTYIFAVVRNNQGKEEYSKIESIDEVFSGKKLGNVNPWAIVLK